MQIAACSLGGSSCRPCELLLLLLLLFAPGAAGQATSACGRSFQHNLNITVTCDAVGGFYRLDRASLLQLNPGLGCSQPLAQGTTVCVQAAAGKLCMPTTHNPADNVLQENMIVLCYPLDAC
jgi:hypothetical protein